MIHYKEGYRYLLVETYEVDTGIQQIAEHTILYGSKVIVSLGPDGHLIINAGYAWDGPSGPTVDTKNFMRGSLVHDALYQLMREGLLAHTWRQKADELLRDICVQDGMSKLRAWYVFNSVRLFGALALNPKSRPVVSV